MILSPRKPPNIRAIHKAFPNVKDNETLFAYGYILYNPGKMRLSPDMWEHEEVHERQQKEFGGSKEWWDKYIVDKEFRLSQEIEAYQAQYKMMKQMIKDETIRLKLLETLAKLLSSPMYGRIISYEDAYYLIPK